MSFRFSVIRQKRVQESFRPIQGVVIAPKLVEYWIIQEKRNTREIVVLLPVPFYNSRKDIRRRSLRSITGRVKSCEQIFLSSHDV